MKNNTFKPFEDKELESYVMQESQKNEKEIFPIEYNNEKYWVKKGRKTASNLFHHLCYKLLPFEFLIPVVSKSEEEAVLFESNKLISFKEKGLNTPEVVGSNSSLFVMCDCGMQVYVYLRKQDVKGEEFHYYLDKYIQEVAKIHNVGLFHGGAQSRNFTYSQEKVYAIDLEDSFEHSVDIETLQFRDLLLLLLSMTKVDNFEFSYSDIINKYIEYTKNDDFVSKLKILARKLNFLVRMNSVSWIHNLLPRDVKGFCYLLKSLQEL